MKKYLVPLALVVTSFALLACNKAPQAVMDEAHLKGVVMEDGKMMTIWEGNETAMMEGDVQLQNGTAMMNGTVKTNDGRVIQLHDGEAMMKDGVMQQANDLHLKMMEGAMMEEGSDEDKEKDEQVMMAKSEGYKDFTASALPNSVLADGQTKVLFFHASWCPICKAENKTLTAWYGADKDAGLLTTYKINYDTEKNLKQKYGVTHQHTFVKVDGKGTMIKLLEGPSDNELKALLTK